MKDIIFIVASIFLEAFFIEKLLNSVIKKKFDILFFIVIFLFFISHSLLGVFHYIYLLLFLLRPLILYFLLQYRKYYNKNINKFLSLIVSLLLFTSVNFFSVLVSSLLSDAFVENYIGPGLFLFITQIIGAILALKLVDYFDFTIKYFYDYEKVFRRIIHRLSLLLLFINFVSTIADLLGNIPHFNSFASIISTICFFTLIYVIYTLKYLKDQHIKKEEIKRKKREQALNQQYTNKIVSLYNEIRGFRHDYAGMLVSMQTGINSGNLEEIKRIYKDVLENANLKLRSDKYTYFDLNNVGDSALRSVFTAKMLTAEELDIEMNFEVKEYVGILPLDLLEVVRISNIILDNALESANEAEIKEVNVSLINIMDDIVFVVRNSRKFENLELEKLYHMDYSTKGIDRGTGLYNLKTIIDSYEHLILDTVIEKHHFTQVITFKKEGVF